MLIFILTYCGKTYEEKDNLWLFRYCYYNNGYFCVTSQSKYSKKARKAAETCLKNKIEEMTWTTVDTGKLKYMNTMYYEVLDKYKVSYYIKFNAADEIEDKWIFIEIELSGKTLGMSSNNVSFCNLDYYERNIKSGLYKNSKGMNDKGFQTKFFTFYRNELKIIYKNRLNIRI